MSDGAAVRRRRLLWPAVAALVVVGLAVAMAAGADDGAPSPGAKGGGPARGFEVPNVRKGEPPITLTSFRGKPVVLNFWASWCVPCRKEMPGFQEVAEQSAGRVAFLGINHQDSRRLAVEFLEKTGVGYPSGYDPDGKVAAAYRLLGMPTTVFISADGTILERRTGEMSRDDLEKTLKRLFDL